MSDDYDNDDIDKEKDDKVVPISDDVDISERYVEVEKATEHQLEELFDIEEGTTMVPYKERVPTELVEAPNYDEKDKEIEEQFQEVYDIAIEAFENSSETGEDVEPKYRARNSEVAAQYLKMALDAANSKSSHKLTKDKLEKTASPGKGGYTQNNIIMDRNEMLKHILGDNNDQQDAIDVTAEEIED